MNLGYFKELLGEGEERRSLIRNIYKNNRDMRSELRNGWDPEDHLGSSETDNVYNMAKISRDRQIKEFIDLVKTDDGFKVDHEQDLKTFLESLEGIHFKEVNGTEYFSVITTWTTNSNS